MLDYAKNHIADLALESVWAQSDKNNKFFFVRDTAGIKLINDSKRCHEFVSVDKENKVIGFIRYLIYDDKAFDLEIISFEHNSSIFARDLIEAVYDIFDVFSLNSVSGAFSFAHPLLPKYLSLMKKHKAIIKKNEKTKYYFFTIYKQ